MGTKTTIGDVTFDSDDVVAVRHVAGPPNWKMKVYLRGGHQLDIESATQEAETFLKLWKLPPARARQI